MESNSITEISSMDSSSPGAGPGLLPGSERDSTVRRESAPDCAEETEHRGSFQDQVLGEIAGTEVLSRKCAMAGLAAMLQCMGCFRTEKEGDPCLILRSGRRSAMTKCFTLMEKTINIASVYVLTEDGSTSPAGSASSPCTEYELKGEAARQIADIFSLPYRDGPVLRDQEVPDRFLNDRRCVRTFLAHQFLCIGTVRNPGKEYYLSYEVLSEDQAGQTLQLLRSEGLNLRIVQHGKSRAIVTRDSDVVVDVLNLLGAHVSMMEMENTRIVRQVRGGVNRQVNCETANIMKTVAASQRQLEEIRLIKESSVWESLPDSLRQIALLREQFPESSLQELGSMLEPPVGKSGVNHRLRRLSAIARDLQSGP